MGHRMSHDFFGDFLIANGEIHDITGRTLEVDPCKVELLASEVSTASP